MATFNVWFVSCFILSSSHALSPEQREEILYVHNWFRSSVVPQAADMHMLVYDTAREAKAQKYAEKCVFEHGYEEEGGENLQLSGHNNFTWVTMDWFHERVYWNFANQTCDQKNAPKGMDYMGSPQCGHYKMMVVARLTTIWCGSHFCETVSEFNGNTYKNKYLNVCRYDFGNRVDMYVSGQPCSGCRLKRPFCNKGLCTACTGSQCDCKVNCKQCGKQLKSCLCLCGVYGNPDQSDCSGSTNFPNPTCGICEGLGKSCLNGGIDVSNSSDVNTCQCKCPSGYSGNQCEYTPEMVQDVVNGVRLLMRGEIYRRGYEIYNPVNYYRFLEIWNDTVKPLLFTAIERRCTNAPDCVDNKNKDLLNVDNIQTAWKTPVLQAWGTLEIIIYMKSSGVYLNKTIMSDAILKNMESINSVLKVKLDAELFSVQPVADDEFISLLPTTPSTSLTTESSQNDDSNGWTMIFAYSIIAIAVILCFIIIGALLCVNYGPLSRRRYRNVNDDIPMKAVKS